MNNVNLIGRVTKDITLSYTTSGHAVTRFTLAVNRRNKDSGADFISCMAWDKTAELLSQYVKKGHRLGVNGRIQTGSYTDKDNKKVYTTDVVVNEIEFLESKASGNNAPVAQEEIPDNFEVAEDDIPF